MITGFNTDIEFEGTTYHVQTEDKGTAVPVILSLIYDRGTILASKRAPYDDLLENGYDEKELAERLHKQHRLICAAVKAGRIEDLKKMTARDADAAKLHRAASRAAGGAGVSTGETMMSSAVAVLDEPVFELGDPIPRPVFDIVLEADEKEPEAITEGIQIIEDDLLVPDEAVEILNGLAGKDRPVNYKLSIEILGSADFKGGDQRTVTVMVCRGSERKVVDKAQIMVKVIGSSFRPLIFHASTDRNGIALVNLQLPSFRAGRAAFLIRAISEGEEVELRRSVSHG